MGLFTADRARRDGRVTLLQLVTSLLGFMLFSVMGGVLIAGLALPAVTVAGQAVNGTAELFEALPEEFNQTTLPQASSIYASDGTTLLATFYNQNREVVPLEEISPWMQKAQIDVEDKRFWLHHGVDGEGLLAAAKDNLGSDSTRGASTITQQLVKNTLIQAAENIEDEAERQKAIDEATEPTLPRKIREWRMAMAYEDKLNKEYGTECSGENPGVDCGKEQVLEQYLNIAQYGPRVYGVEAAAQLYFGVSAKELDAIQSATIAGITQNPSRWDPLRFPEQAEERRNIVLQRMFEQKHLTLAEYTTYKNTPLESTLNPTSPKFSCAASDLAPFFCDYVTRVITKHEVFRGEGKRLLFNGGLRIITTLDVDMQTYANDSVRKHAPIDDPSGIEDALAALDVKTGNIVAMAQNRYFDPTSKAPYSTAINLSVSRDLGGSRGFSPGSSFKPVILAAWLDSGRALREYVSGYQRTYTDGEFRACGAPYTPLRWSPGNVEASENRQTSVLDATAYSVNTAYVSMAHALDLCEVRDMAVALGFERADGAEIETVPSISLGTQNASPLTMASVYQTFANRGVHCEPRAILEITNLDGTPAFFDNGDEVKPPDVACTQAIRQDVADGVTFAMTKVMDYGTGKRLNIGMPSAGKTGTSQENKHLWFVGYTPYLVAAAWGGNAEVDQALQGTTIGGKRLRYWYGADLGGPVWYDFMVRAAQKYPAEGFPEPTSQILNGIQKPVPDVVTGGLSEKDAQVLINDAGFNYAKSAELLYRPGVPAGTIVHQEPAAGTLLLGGSTVTYYISTDAYPGWWYNWPSGWDPLQAPSDWWGGAWPPADWTPNNPSNGWDPTPDPDPGGGGPGGGGPGGGGPGGGGPGGGGGG